MRPATTPLDLAPAVARIVTYFETLTPQSVRELGTYYAAQAHFKDPFNSVQGVPAITQIFDHMFSALAQPRFVITGQVLQGQQCFLTWEFRFCFKNFQKSTAQTIFGASHLVFSDEGLITAHRDYWDAAEELYEKLPLVGRLMRWLKQRATR